jgi:hypothetical protein
MKKSLVLVLALAMVFSVAIVASAATTTIGGNVRVWYVNTDSTNKATNISSKDNTFVFDRVALDLKSDLGDGENLFTEIQGRTINKGITSETHFFVDQAYWSKANCLVDGGTLMVGAFDGQPIPFKNGYSDVILSGGLGDGLKIGNAVGVVYQYNQDLFGFGLAVVNANTGFTKNAAETSTVDGAGYAWSARFDYKPMAGLKAGVGYLALQDVDATTNQNAVSEQTRIVVDASYKNMEVTPFRGMVEYAKVNFDDSAKDDPDAWYGEVGYAFGKAVAYLGYGDGDIYGNNGVVKSAQTTSSFYIMDDNYTVVGLTYALSGSTFLQGEYAKSGSDNDGFGLRLRVNF